MTKSNDPVRLENLAIQRMQETVEPERRQMIELKSQATDRLVVFLCRENVRTCVGHRVRRM